MCPKIIKRDSMLIAGVSGDGNKTGEVWESFMILSNEKPLTNKLSDNGYESENNAMNEWLANSLSRFRSKIKPNGGVKDG